jgi:hypothetical protein
MSNTLKLALVSALALGGCAKDEPKVDPAPAPTAAEEVAEREVSPLAPEEPESSTPSVATPEDFEEEAARTVRLENLDAELDRLEAEIDG